MVGPTFGRGAFRHVVLAVAVAVSSAANAETVSVKYRGTVDLKPFDCEGYTSSLAKRICYDARENYLLVSLNSTYYHYCEIPATVVGAWRSAESLGRFIHTLV